MQIKYKRHTGPLLRDLALALKIPMNLKVSEHILKVFFEKILKEVTLEKSIVLITNLPPHLKPFCTKSGNEYLPACIHFSKDKTSDTIKVIIEVLERHLQPQNLAEIYTCLPEDIFINRIFFKKKVLQSA